ncbi:MAG: hypothetical protein IT530_02255 [Burkholderiales bacterium]|nr:hypothetical protein [Burkholderiales bacterium]
MPENEREGYEYVGGALQASSVRPGIGNAFLAWLNTIRARGVPAESVQDSHGFDFGRCEFDPEDQPYLAEFGNAMAAAGATQADIDALLTAYGKIQQDLARVGAANARDAERLDLEDRDRAADAMRAEWGEEYRANIRLINRYLDGLPETEREAIESARLDDGTLALNDPAKLRELAHLARGGGKSAKPPAEERAEIERIMREDRTRYNRDERLQARYRDLLRTGGSAQPLPKHRSGINAEIATIEKLMRENRVAYNRDEGKQHRLRQLYAARDA